MYDDESPLRDLVERQKRSLESLDLLVYAVERISSLTHSINRIIEKSNEDAGFCPPRWLFAILAGCRVAEIIISSIFR